MDLGELRDKINKIDSEIVSLLKKRDEVSEKIGEYKKEKSLKVFDSAREEKVLERLKGLARQGGVDEEFVLKIFREMIEHSKEVQKGV